MIKIIILTLTLTLTSCNIYELVDQGNIISDEFEELLNKPNIQLLTGPVSLSQINNSDGTGAYIYFRIVNGTFINSSGNVLGITITKSSSLNGNLNSSNFEYVNSQTMRYHAKKSGLNMSCTPDCFINFTITLSSYNTNDGLPVMNDYFSIEVLP